MVASFSHLRELALFIQSCTLLDSDASAELREAEISADAEAYGSQHSVMDDCKTHRDSLMQATKQ